MSVEIQNLLQKSTGLSPEQLKTLWNNTSMIRSESIGDALSKKTFQNAEELVSELCKELGLDFMKDIPYNDISADLVREIPINYSKQNSILPFKEESDQVIVLVSNPLNIKALDDLRVLFGKRIKPVVTLAGKLLDAINRVYEK